MMREKLDVTMTKHKDATKLKGARARNRDMQQEDTAARTQAIGRQNSVDFAGRGILALRGQLSVAGHMSYLDGWKNVEL